MDPERKFPPIVDELENVHPGARQLLRELIVLHEREGDLGGVPLEAVLEQHRQGALNALLSAGLAHMREGKVVLNPDRLIPGPTAEKVKA